MRSRGATSGVASVPDEAGVKISSELRLVRSLTGAISEAPNLHSAYVQALRRICTSTKWDFGEAWLPGDDANVLVGSACWVGDPNLTEFAKTLDTYRFRIGQGLPGRVWQQRQPQWVEDVAALSRREFLRLHEARRAGLHAAAAIPLVGKSGPVAVLVFFVRSPRRRDLALMRIVQAAVGPLVSLMARLRVEEELEDHRKRLELLVAERTRSLEQSQEELRIKDRLASIGALAAGLGHDMNNVLLPVRAHLSALRKAGKSPRAVAGHVRQVAQSVSYLQHLADGLHYLAVDPDVDIDTEVQLDLRQWWTASSSLLANAVSKRATFSCDLQGEMPRVRIGGPALTQAILNLLVNSAEAVDAAGRAKDRSGTVKLWMKADAKRGIVRVGVTDNGCGMTPTVKRRAMDLFFSTRVRGLGTGLGLALVQRVVARAGGSVRITSAPGHGTTVVLTLRSVDPVRRHAMPGRTALFTANARTRALVKAMVEAYGGSVAKPSPREQVDAWVCDATAANLDGALAWRERERHGKLVLIGPVQRGVMARWRRLRPLSVIDDPLDFELVRTAIGSAMGITRKEATSGKKGS